MHMFQYGLPRLLAPPGVRARVRRAEQGDSPDAEPELMQALAETTEWLMALVCAISAYEEQPELARQQILATPRHQRLPSHQREEQARRDRPSEASAKIRLGRDLVIERDSKKRTYEETPVHEQEVMAAYELGNLKRQRREAAAKRAAPVRTSVPGSHASASGAWGSASVRAGAEGAR